LKIPVFVSCPSQLNDEQKISLEIIWSQLEQLNLEPRTLGRTDYPVKHPLYEVLVVACHCAGGVILGFGQFEARSGTWKKGSQSEREIDELMCFPTPWNNLEAGILYASGLPLLIFREKGIEGGVFDPGVTDVYIHDMPTAKPSKEEMEELKEIMLAWQTDVRMNYYGKYRHPRSLS